MTDSVLSAYSGDLSQMLSALSGMSARPAFNLAFAKLQVTATNRYNTEMAALQQKALDRYDVSLDKELANLKGLLPKLVEHQDAVGSARAQLIERIDEISSLDEQNASLQTAAAKGEPVDPSRFNAQVKTIDEATGGLPFLDGAELSFYGDEGVGEVRLNGLGLAPFSVDDNNANPPTGSSQDLLKARTKANNMVEQLANRLDMVSGEVGRVQDRITELEDHQQASAKEIKQDVAKKAAQMKLALGQQLQALSLGFEIQQISNEKMTKSLAGDTYQPGSVINLFS